MEGKYMKCVSFSWFPLAAKELIKRKEIAVNTKS
jgi:hypothetical protein